MRALRKTDPLLAAGNVATLDALVLQANALRAFLFGVDPTSVPMFTAAGSVLLVMTIAVTVPCAVRAMRVDARSGTE